ncbi:hypothetical protein K458DRAFT_425276 [Lentithecium fluviatile CBS 122367]|uniref:Uncharacterized protein n=1 Tax=Lentithecium fluviatile CBS 122367 TaxID=1168545 RepID=A0A6G1IBW0_9PLEO|nr:hypothetical protein K458DRAFT_425276 [Lentithecium fluviatile CBS 122367]
MAEDEGTVTEIAELKLIARKFHRMTGAYLEQYKMGKSWLAWERKVETFDINNPDDVKNYNRWINQLCDKFDHRHHKRPARPCWTEEEIAVLRGHFNDLIDEKGLIVAHDFSNWEQVRDKVANVGTEPRMTNSVQSMAERDIFVHGDERMGIHEWREFGRDLRRLQRANPTIAIPNNVLFPGLVIPMDSVKARRSGATEDVEYYNFRRDGPDRVPKLSAKVVDGEVIVMDRFGGDLVRRYGLMDHFRGVTKEKVAVGGEDAVEDGSMQDQSVGLEAAIDQVLQEAGYPPEAGSEEDHGEVDEGRPHEESRQV